MLRDFLDRYVSVVEIVFAISLAGTLPYAIYSGDTVTTAAIVGGVLGYLKGYSSGNAAPPKQSDINAAIAANLIDYAQAQSKTKGE